MSNKQVRYKDEEIRDRSGRRFYLRTKHTVRSSYRVLSIRTQKNGFGKCLARVQFVVISDASQDEAIKRLIKKWRKFYWVILIDAFEEASKNEL